MEMFMEKIFYLLKNQIYDDVAVAKTCLYQGTL